MKKILLSIISFSIIFLLLSGIGHADEKDVLRALEKIKGNVEVGLNFRTYNELISNAQVEINILKRTCKNTKFMSAVEACLKNYQAGMMLWKMGNDMGRQRDPFDDKRNEHWHEASKLLDAAYKAL